jgi:hypothetical protein
LRLNGNLEDSSNQANDGVFSGDDDSSLSNNFTSTGVPDGNGLLLDGTDDFVSVPDITLGPRNFTVETWFLTDRLEHRHLLADDTADQRWLIGIEAGGGTDNLAFWIGDGSSWNQANNVAGSTALTTGTWYHAALVRSGQHVTLYLNGRAEAFAQIDSGHTVPGTMARVGGMGGGTANWDGTVDEVAFYNRALSVDEIRRSCRRVQSPESGVQCPDTREPVILTPLPNQELPPTRAYWSWRGERGRDGDLLYPAMEHEVRFDIDGNQNGTFTDPFVDYQDLSVSGSDIVASNGSSYHVENNWIDSLNDYRLKIRPIENGTTLRSFESTRTFSTNNRVVAWWRFESDNPSLDEISRAANALLGGPTPDSSGLLGGALQFDGQNDYVNITDPTAPAAIESADDGHFTIEGWFQPQRLDTLGQTLISRGGDTFPGGSNVFYMVDINDGLLAFKYRAGTAPVPTTDPSYSVTATDPLVLNQWTHFAAVRFKGHVGEVRGPRLYQDGQLAASLSDDNDASFVWLPDYQRPLILGADRLYSGSGGITFFQGLMDEVIFYREALSPSQVCNSYLAFCMGNLAGVECDTACVGD